MDVRVEVRGDGVEIEATAETVAQTGVEMEALTVASVAALTVYDMAKAVDPGMSVESVQFRREDERAGVKVAVLTVSDGVHEGTRADDSGDTLADLLTGAGFEVARSVVPDEPDAIERALLELAASARVVLTTGGTGFAPRDVTPEATRRVLEREAPGIAEAIRADAATRTPYALLERAAGLHGATLIVNLPGLPGGAATASRSRSRRSGTRWRWPRASAIPATARRERAQRIAAVAARLARQARAHRLRAAVRARRRIPGRRRLSGLAPRGSPSRCTARTLAMD